MSAPPARGAWRLLRPALMALDAERAHHLGLAALELAAHAPFALEWLRARHGAAARPVRVLGLDFANPLGLAAGFDKDARALPALSALGFGHVEIGTVTPRPQPGNARPRIFRVKEHGCLVNRMGFPSEGASVVAGRLAATPRSAAPCVVGVNLGKNKGTPPERAADDYVAALRCFAAVGDYLVLNVSSPNTPGLRDLQDGGALAGLVAAVVAEERHVASLLRRAPRAVLVKLAPDLSERGLLAALDAAAGAGASGFIAANTTLARPAELGTHAALSEPGGLSGPPLLPRALEMVGVVATRFGGRLPVVGVGGVSAPEDVDRMLDAGASLVQLYTGFVYGGPATARRLLSSPRASSPS